MCEWLYTKWVTGVSVVMAIASRRRSPSEGGASNTTVPASVTANIAWYRPSVTTNTSSATSSTANPSAGSIAGPTAVSGSASASPGSTRSATSAALAPAIETPSSAAVSRDLRVWRPSRAARASLDDEVWMVCSFM